jgi:hypothetical protein
LDLFLLAFILSSIIDPFSDSVIVFYSSK